jgi:hypothetical protein
LCLYICVCLCLCISVYVLYVCGWMCIFAKLQRRLIAVDRFTADQFVPIWAETKKKEKKETAMLKGPTNSHHGSPIICHPHLPWLKCTENFALTFEKNILGKKLLSLFGISSIIHPICHDLNIMFAKEASFCCSLL